MRHPIKSETPSGRGKGFQDLSNQTKSDCSKLGTTIEYCLRFSVNLARLKNFGLAHWVTEYELSPRADGSR